MVHPPARLPGGVTWPPEFAQRYRAAGYWTGETLGGLLARSAHQHGGRTALVDGDRRWSYRELDDRATGLAAGLAGTGVRPGDRVVVQLPNVAEFVEVVFALFRLGALPVFALPAHRSTELRHITEQAGAVAIVTAVEHDGFGAADAVARIAAEVPSVRLRIVVDGGTGAAVAGAVPLDSLRAMPRDMPDVASSGVAFLQLSGGTTGLPKLIPRTHDDYLYSVRASARICRLHPGSVYLVTLPAAHNFPMSSPGILGTLYAGGRVVMCPRPDPDTAFALVESEGVTITGVVPPIAAVWAQAALRSSRDLSRLEVLQVGGARCSVELARRIGPSLGVRLQQVFGMAEGLVNYTRLDDPEELVLHTQGRPISPDDEIRIVDPEDPGEREVAPGETGALLTRGPYTIRGYHVADGPLGAAVVAHNAVSFTPDGFYRTGDLVRRTPEGYLVVTGRMKEQINRGGEKVAPEEIENHLLAHPAVLDAAVVAMPDLYLGERTCAYVRPVPGAERPTPAALRAFVRARGVAAFVVPDRVEVVEEFPATGLGKTSKRELRAAIAAQLRPSGR